MCKLNADEMMFINELYVQYYDELLRYAKSFLDDSNSEEAVQNVFMDACRKVDVVSTYDKPIGWLVRALQFSISKVIRSKTRLSKYVVYMAQRAEPEFGQEFGMEDFPDKRLQEEDLDILYCDLAPQKEFQFMKKFAVNGKSIKELAKDENLTVAACSQKLYRYRKKLRQALSEEHKN